LRFSGILDSTLLTSSSNSAIYEINYSSIHKYSLITDFWILSASFFCCFNCNLLAVELEEDFLDSGDPCETFSGLPLFFFNFFDPMEN